MIYYWSRVVCTVTFGGSDLPDADGMKLLGRFISTYPPALVAPHHIAGPQYTHTKETKILPPRVHSVMDMWPDHEILEGRNLGRGD